MNKFLIRWSLILALPVILLSVTAARAALDLPQGFFTHAGSDGVFAPGANVTVDLSLATTAAWDSAGGGNGVYDPDKWAVVFKYSSVNIPSGVTVTFKNHSSRAPVVWLIDGNATIDGQVLLNGQDYTGAVIAGEPGPGGFRGGYNYRNVSQFQSAGFGPGGSLYMEDGARRDGGYATVGNTGVSEVYGNVRILPLIGGSGGGGGYYYTGGAGGGAILIVTSASMTVNGLVQSVGGTAIYHWSVGWYSGVGSGGAVRLVADSFGGKGTVSTDARDASAAKGRVRLEANTVTGTVNFYPVTDVMAPDDPVLIWPPDAAPSVTVVSIGQIQAPTDPHASLEVGQTDVVIDHTETTQIRLQTLNVDTVDGTVRVRVSPRSGDAFLVNAVFNSGTRELATWIAEATMPDGFFVVQAIAKNPEPQD
ncbi:MAG: hypothetical protein V2B19_23575 [Pseudomonadota bacterium]